MSSRLKMGLALILASTSLSSFALAQGWNGPYVGIKGGIAAIGSHESDTGFGAASDDAYVTGRLIGLEAGYNSQLGNNFVWGVAGDYAFSSASGDGNWNGSDFTIDLKNLGTVQMKLGKVIGSANETLVYLAGGLAGGEVSLSQTEATRTHFGYVVSTGVEQMLSKSVSIKAEASYVSLGKEDYRNGESVDLDGVIGSVGLNFHF